MIVRFDKKDRSTFPYWFAHWCAFQMVALNLGVWKFKYLFHDWYKPWMKLVCKYKTVQTFHNKYSNHHLLHYFLQQLYYDADWEQMIIDWECCQYTKQQCPLNARGEYERIFSTFTTFDKSNKTVKQLYEMGILPINHAGNKIEFDLKLEYAKKKLLETLNNLGL